MTTHKIINGDSRIMSELDNESIHLIITSPPYWQLKDYGTDNQIGFHDDYENYVNHLNLVWSECNRVLHKGCRLCINIGDQFARSVYYGRYKIIPIRTEIIKFCESIGLDYMGAIIWQKATTMNTSGGATIMGSFPYPRNGILKLDYEFILIFKKQGKAPNPSLENKERSKLTKEEWNTYFSGHWNFAGTKQDTGHLAMFPEELPKRLIKMFSFVGDTVLDPFLGSGTTSLAARLLDRNSVGYEINPEFIPIIKEKIGVHSNLIFDTVEFEFITQKPITIDFQDKIKHLPYIFVDSHKLDKKIDIKKIQFGSKIDKESRKIQELYTIKQIISPELVELSTGIKVRLIGIKEDISQKEKAIEFLKNKTKGQKVFLKFDDTLTHDEHDNLFAYLYLQNKTFINAHLIKNGLVFIDNSYEYKYKKKFNELACSLTE